MCEVEICDSSIVEVVDNEAFNDIGGVTYDHYEVGVADDDQYEEVTCENDDSQGLMLQNIEDGMLKHTKQSILMYLCDANFFRFFFFLGPFFQKR